MKILFLNYEFPPLGGGAANATLNILKELGKRNDLEIDLVTSSTDKYKEEQFAPNIKIYYLDIGKAGNIHFQSQKELVKYAFKAFKFAKKLKKSQNYDLVHAFFGIPCGFVAMFLKISYIVSLRGTDVPFYNERFKVLDKLIFRWLNKNFIWKRALAVITNSEGLKNLALRSSPSQKIGVIYNGVDTEKFHPDETMKNKEFTILYNSRFIERKGIRYLIDAFIKFNSIYPESRLLTISSGNLEEEMKRKVKEVGIENAVEFYGALSPKTNEIAEIYRKCHVFVLPSLNEGMSNSLLEALATGMPIIATDTGGTKELVGSDNGIIIPMHSSQAIFEALERLYKDQEQMNDMGKKSRERAEKMSWATTAEQYYQIYKKHENC